MRKNAMQLLTGSRAVKTAVSLALVVGLLPVSTFASSTQAYAAEEDAVVQPVSMTDILSKNIDLSTIGVETPSFFGLRSALNISDVSAADLVDTGQRIRTKASFIDANKYVEGLTIDDIMGNEENVQSMYLYTQQYATTVYDFGNEDYYVAFLDMPYQNGVSTQISPDALFARDNDGAEMIEGCVWDAENGVAYIPRSFADNYEPVEDVDRNNLLQAQILCLYDQTSAEAEDNAVTVPMNVVNTTTGEAVNTDVTATNFDRLMNVQLVDAADGDKVDASSIVITTNDDATTFGAVDANEDTSAAAAVYDSATGVLAMSLPAMSIANARISFASVEPVAVTTASARGVVLGNGSNIGFASPVFDQLDLGYIADHWGELGDKWFTAFAYRDTAGDYGYTRSIGYGAGEAAPDVNSSTALAEVPSSSAYTFGLFWNYDFTGVPNWDYRRVLMEEKPGVYAMPVGSVQGNNNVGANETLHNMNWHFKEYVEPMLVRADCAHISVPFPKFEGLITDVMVKVIGVNTNDNSITLAFISTCLPGSEQTCETVLKFRVESQGDMDIQKVSSNPAISSGNSQYTFEGIEYGIYSDEGCTNLVQTMTLDANGYGKSGALSAGTYHVREIASTATSRGYWADTTVYHPEVASGRTTRVNVDTVSDTPINDPLPILVGKYDPQTGAYSNALNLPQGAAKLNFARFEIRYYDATENISATNYDDATSLAHLKATWIMQTDEDGFINLSHGNGHFDVHDANGNVIGNYPYKVSGDPFYYETTASGERVITVPRGTIVVKELQAPEGYNEDPTVHVQVVKAPGDTSTVSTYNEPEVANQVIRGGFYFIKADEVSQERMANVAFLVTSETTGESHVVVTDENGLFNTDAVPHSRNTNASDAAWNGRTIDDSKLNANSGIWFGLKSDGTRVAVSDSMGALPYDSYVVQELPCAANEHKQLVEPVRFTISENLTTVDLGTIDDPEVVIGTYATDKADGDKQVAQDNSVTIVDRVDYSNLIADRQYRLEAQLVDASNGNRVLATGTTTFTPNRTYGYQNVELTTNTLALANHSLVVYEKLVQVDNGRVLAEHADSTDSNQTVTVIPPEIGTNAVDGVDDDKTVIADPTATIVDTVSYTGLVPGKEYTVAGTLMNKATNAALVVNGSQVKVSRTFTPEKSTGEVELTFAFNASVLPDATEIVVFETLSRAGTEVAVHADINDKHQTVKTKTPKIATSAADGADGDKKIVTDPEAVLVDTVTYSGLLAGQTYKLDGVVMNKATGAALVVDGNQVTASTTFTPDDSHGTVNVTFNFASSAINNNTDLVVFESLTRNGSAITDHRDLNDAGQTVTVTRPTLGTSAADGMDGDKTLVTDTAATIVDTVSYTGLVPGKEYTVTGTLMNKDTNSPLTAGAQVTNSVTFTPDLPNGTVQVPFTVDTTALADKEIVVFERLYRNEVRKGFIEIAVHTNINDANQTLKVTRPSIATTAVDGVDADKNIVTDTDATVVDTVAYENVVPGREYVVSGWLMDKSTGEALTINGNRVTATTSFVPDHTHGTVDVTYNFDATGLAGKNLVAFETLSTNGVEVAWHHEINDAAQTTNVSRPVVATTALDGIDGDKNVVTDPEAVVVDTVAYENVVPGREYVVSGILMDKDTGNPILVDGKQVTSSATFTPLHSIGEVDVTFNFDGSALTGKKVVVFETLSQGGIEIAWHHDIDDADQTTDVTRPELATTALDGVDNDKNVVVDDAVVVVDTVALENIVPGKEYTIRGTLMDKETGEPILVDGKQVTSFTTFTPDHDHASVDVTFEFNGLLLAGHDLVAFETLYRNGVEMATHAEIDDAAQTVNMTPPEIATSAVDGIDSDKNVVTDPEAVIVDTVSYENVIPGREYVVTGTLMDKETGDPILVDGKEVTASSTFTSDHEHGTVDVTFNFDGTALTGKEIVVFESLSRTGVEIATHADINDEKQTTEVTRPVVKTMALDGIDGDKNIVADPEAVVIDTVSYENVVPNKEYVVTGVLVDQETGEPLLFDPETGSYVTPEDQEEGVEYKEATASTTFTPLHEVGTVDVTFNFDGTLLADKQIVVFETLSRNGIDVAWHEDTTDADQTADVTPPVIETMALDGVDGDKNIVADDAVVIVDTVSYTNLVPGKEYVVTGTLMDKELNEPLLFDPETGVYVAPDDRDADVEYVEANASTTFTPDHEHGTVEVTFEIDGALLAGKQIVVFESLTRNGIEVTTHSDIEDENQTTDVVPTEISTSAVDGFDGDKNLVADSTATIVDSVKYWNALAGDEYRVAGVLMDKDTGLPLLVGEGSEDVSEDELRNFVEQLKTALGIEDEADEDAPEDGTGDSDGDGTTDGDGSDAGNTTDGNMPKATDDTEDDTDGSGSESGTDGTEGEGTTDTDGEGTDGTDGEETDDTYVLKVPLYPDFEALDKLFVDNADLLDMMVVSTSTFTPEYAEGTHDVTFEFDASQWIETEKVKDTVVFEVLYKEDVIVAAHTDINDETQKVTIIPSEIGTQATDKSDGDQSVQLSRDITVVDTVAYTGLLPGKEYRVDGILMDKSTNKPLMVADKTVESSVLFTPNTADGEIVVEFTFDATGLAGKEIVAFETVYKEDVEVAVHADLNDKNQTVTVDKNPPTGNVFDKTGDILAQYGWLIVVLLIAGGGAVAYGVRQRKLAQAADAAEVAGSDEQE